MSRDLGVRHGRPRTNSRTANVLLSAPRLNLVRDKRADKLERTIGPHTSTGQKKASWI